MQQSDNDPQSYEEALLTIIGHTPKEAKDKVSLSQHLHQASQKYLNSPVSGWPDITFNWDTSRQSQHHTLDGTSPSRFTSLFSDGFLLGYVDVREFDSRLNHFSKRDEQEIWEVGFRDKLARLLVYLSEGRPISPPLAKPLDSGEITLQGGHHRYTIAKFKGETEIPIYVERQYQPAMARLLTVRWE